MRRLPQYDDTPMLSTFLGVQEAADRKEGRERGREGRDLLSEQTGWVQNYGRAI